MITVYTDEAYVKLYKAFKEFNLFELAEKTRFRPRDTEEAQSAIELLSAWIRMHCKYEDLLEPSDYRKFYISKEAMQLYTWMDNCKHSTVASYCHTCSNFQVHYMKHNDTFLASTPKGMVQVTIETVLDDYTYNEWLDYRKILYAQERTVRQYNWWDDTIVRALSGVTAGVYNLYNIHSCVNHIQFTCEHELTACILTACILDDQPADKEEDDEKVTD